MGNAGYLLIYSGAGVLSTPMGEAEVGGLCEAAVAALRNSMESTPE
jgi:hypothetical protein